VKLPITHDVMLMGTAYEMSAEHGLKKMAKNYLNLPDWDISTKDKKSNNIEAVRPYLTGDLMATWELFKFFNEKLSKKQWRVYKEILRPAYRMYRDVERNGVYLHKKKLRKVKELYANEADRRLANLNKKHNINWNSPPQIQNVLFVKEGMPILGKSAKTGKPSADASVLKKLAVQGYELAQELIDYKFYCTANKMFLNRWGEDSAYDGRVHPSFNITNVATGRTSCSDPNLQQVPRNKELRTLFTAPKGRIFIEADYSQIELRIAADYAKENKMINIYKTNGDIHTETARTLTGGREPTKDERNKAKAVNFGFLYGMSARGFIDYAFNSYNAVFTIQEAQLYREMFFAKYPRLLDWHKEMEYICEAEGGVSNRFGRFRALPLIYSRDYSERASAIRRAINSPVQGTASDLLLMSCVEMHKAFKKEDVKIVGTVHDAVLIDAPANTESWLVPEVKRIMSHPKILDEFGIKFATPIVADIGIGAWGAK